LKNGIGGTYLCALHRIHDATVRNTLEYSAFTCQARERNMGTRIRKQFFHAARRPREKKIFRRVVAANSMYPADRARFLNEFDKLSRRAAKTPLTSLLAGIKSATRTITCCASRKKAKFNGSDETGCGDKTIGARSECNSGVKLGLGSAEPRQGGGPTYWPAFSLVRASFS
jgi:hypothetical protein